MTPTPVGNPINIDITDTNGITESSSADPSLTFVDTAFRFYADGVSSAIGPQLAGKTSTLTPGNQALTLRAIRTDTATGACTARLTGSQSVEMAFECDNPSSCKTANGVSISGTAVPGNSQGNVSSYGAVNLVFDASGSAPFTLNYRDAGRIVLHARKDLPATAQEPAFTLSGSSNIFTVSPAGLCIETTDAGADCTLPYASCSGFRKAGEGFNLIVKGVTWESSGETNSDFCTGSNSVTPNFSLSSIAIQPTLLAPAGGHNGTFGTGSIDITSGNDGERTFQQQYSEVGAVTATANPLISYFGETIQASTSEPIGRFYPARFQVTANTPTFNNACEGVNTTAFTYLGQEPTTGGFGYAVDPVFTITAQNLGGVFTRNYGGSFWKLNTALTNRTFSNDTVTTASFSREVTGNTNLTGDADYDATPPEISLSDSLFMYSRPVAEEPPFSALVDLALQESDLTDSDGVCYTTTGASCNTNDGDSGETFIIEDITGALLRYGRGFGHDSYGTMGNSGEYIDVTVGTLFWNGSQWVINSDDGCTNGNLNYSSAELFNYSKTDSGVSTNATPPPALTVTGGEQQIRLTLQTDTNGGQTVVTPSFPSWLTGGPSATAHFGIYRGDDRFIYWREVE
ncbi:MAG: hypothetical protein MI754_10320 [Chromatiales bacterium]|nr:hypothetical protein [Chromatiales bacterium]